MAPTLHRELAGWATTKPTIAALYVFGSCTRANHRPESDLDLAFEFVGVDDELVELLVHRDAWQRELVAMTGLVVRDLYLWSDRDTVKPPIVTIYKRPVPSTAQPS
jgi:predicted nucleotidyltransferase